MFQRNLLSGIIGTSLALTHGVASVAPQDGRTGKKPEASAPAAKADPPRSQAPARPPGSRTLLPRAWDEAFRAARAMKDPSDRAEALLTLAWAQVDQSPLAARKTLLEARAAAEAIPSNSARIHPYPIVRIAEAQAAAGDRDAAHQTFQAAVRMIVGESEGRQLQEWLNLRHRQLKVESRAAMADTFRECRRFNESIGIWGRDSVIALDAALSGDVEKAVKEITSRKANDPRFADGVPGNLEVWRCDRLLDVMEYFGRDERAKLRPVRDEIRKIAGALNDRLLRPQILQELADQEARLGLYNEAVATADAIDPSDTANPNNPDLDDFGSFKKVEAYASIASRRLEAGDREGARRTARQAVEAARLPEGGSRQTGPLHEAVDVLVRTGDRDEARQAVDSVTWPPSAIYFLRKLARAEARRGSAAQARDALTKALKMARDNHQPAETIAEIQAEMGDIAAAIETVNTLEPDKRPQALGRVAVGLATAGRLDDAVPVVEKISDPAIRGRAWIDIVAWFPAP